MRVEVVKMGDDESGRKFPRSSCDSLGKDEERKRARGPCGSRPSYGKICNRINARFEGGSESKAPKRWGRCSV